MKRLLALALLIATLTSCVSNKKLTYLQRAENDTTQFYQLARTDYRLQESDIISINIRSLDAESSGQFSTTGAQAGNLNAGDLLFYLNGYTVSKEGFVIIPVLGPIHVKDLTIEEAEEAVRKGLKRFFKEIFVSVQLSGIRFSVVGDVNRPGKFTIYQDQATIFDALALAGDGQITANRNEIQVVRQTPQGIKMVELDLTDLSVIGSPYYLLQPNDVINVKPLKVKSYGIGTTGFQTIALSLATLANALLIITYFQN